MAHTNLASKSLKPLLIIRKYSNGNIQNVWSKGNVIKSPFKDVQLPKMPVVDYVWQNLEKWADKKAMVCGVTNRFYTYHQLYKYSRKIAVKLRTQMKVREGDVTCVMMPNNPEYALATLGSLEAGAIVTTINPVYTAHEVQKQLLHSKPKVIIGSHETVGIIKEACKQIKMNVPIIAVKNFEGHLPQGTISFHEIIDDENVDFSPLKQVVKDIDNVALLPYSSGTTGLPKGVELVNKTIVANFAQSDIDRLRQYNFTTSSYQESIMGVLPFYHIYGLCPIMLHKLSVGAKIVTLPKFEPKTFLYALQRYQISLLYIVPPLALFMGSYPDATKKHLASVKKIISGAAPLPKQDIIRILEKCSSDIDFLQIYGLTELSPLATSSVQGSKNYTTVGVALPNTQLRVVDTANNCNLGPKEVGELWVKGPQIMKGYKNNPDETNTVITDDGWFRSGDLASIDNDGIVTICDRIKELIKVKGFQVPPAELENVLKEHPDVLDAAVIGIPDPKLGEVPKAFVVLKDGSKRNASDIMTFVKERVAAFKRLSTLEFLDNLPRNPSGKILKKVLKENYS